MRRNDFLTAHNKSQLARPALSKGFSGPKVVLGKIHLHVLVDRPAGGGAFETIIDLGDSQPAGTDEFYATPHGWDLYFVDEQTGDPVEAPLHALVVTADGWFASDGHCKVQIRALLQDANDTKYWIGQVGFDGLYLGPA